MFAQDKYFYVALCFSFIALVLLTPNFGHSWDNQCWRDWATHTYKNGLGNAYGCNTDYPPLIHYFLWAFGKIMGDEQYMRDNFKMFRIFVLAIEFIGALFIVSQAKDKKINGLAVFVILLNPAMFYDSVVWGQTDGILSTFLMISLFAAANKQVFVSFLFYLLAFNFKLQTGVFLPIIFLINLPEIKNNVSLKSLIIGIVLLIMVQLIILFPFIKAGRVEDIIRVFRDSFSKFEVVSMNAYNFWMHRFGNDVNFEPDTQKVLGITLKTWGLAMFFISSFFALWPFFMRQIRAWFNKNLVSDKPLLDDVLLIGGLINILFFYFPTEMHERYSFPALFLIGAYAIRNNSYRVYIFLSLAFFLNLERVLAFLGLKDYHGLVFNIKFVSLLYLITIVLLFIEIYKGYNWRHDFKNTFTKKLQN